MTTPRVLPASAPAPTLRHEHAWVTESVHATSEGRVRYVRCAGCVTRRVDLDPSGLAPASALSREIGELRPSSGDRDHPSSPARPTDAMDATSRSVSAAGVTVEG